MTCYCGEEFGWKTQIMQAMAAKVYLPHWLLPFHSAFWPPAGQPFLCGASLLRLCTLGPVSDYGLRSEARRNLFYFKYCVSALRKQGLFSSCSHYYNNNEIQLDKIRLYHDKNMERPYETVKNNSSSGAHPPAGRLPGTSGLPETFLAFLWRDLCPVRVTNLHQFSQDCFSFKIASFLPQALQRPVQLEISGHPTERRQVKELKDHACDKYLRGTHKGLQEHR